MDIENDALRASKADYEHKLANLMEASNCKASVTVPTWAIALLVALLVLFGILQKQGIITNAIMHLL